MSSAGRRAGEGRGSWLVAGLLLLGVAAAVGGILFQRQQTRKCLEFYGPAAARRITTAAAVDLLVVRPGSGPRRLAKAAGLDVSQAAGLVHLRRGLVEDANFNWPSTGAGHDAVSRPKDAAGGESLNPRPLSAWDAAIVFRDPVDSGQTVLAIDFDGEAGALAVVGQPGWIGLGRIGPGLKTWIRDSWNRAGRGDDAVVERPAQAEKSR